MSPRQFAPPTLAATILGGAILAPFSRVIRVLWLLAVIVYALGNLGASWQIARKTDERHFRLLPGIFAILHFGYGLGFLRGLLKEAVQRLSPPADGD